MLLSAVVAGLMLSMAGARAGDLRPAVAHGREIADEAVGPAVLGRTSADDVPGGVLARDRLPPYVRRVAEPATYHGFTIAGGHLLIENVTIHGALDISTPLPVVLRAVTVRAEQDVPWLVLVRPGAGPLHVLYCDIGAAHLTRGASPHAGMGLALRADGARVYRSRIGGAADGIQIAARDIRVMENVVANLLSRPGDHNDAVQLFHQAADVEIARNRIENRHPQTSAVTVLGHDIRITSNVLAGGGYALYGGAANNGKGGEGASRVSVEANIFSRRHFPKVGHFGAVAYWAAGPGSGNVWRGNTDDAERPLGP